MGKKRRVLRSPKFANLRKHPKYAGMVRGNKGAKEDLSINPLSIEEDYYIPKPTAELEVKKVEEKEPLIEAPTPILSAVEEALALEPVAEEKPKRRRTRKTTAKKATTRKRTTRKKVGDKE